MSTQDSESDGGGGYSGEEADTEELPTSPPADQLVDTLSDDSDVQTAEKAESKEKRKTSPVYSSDDQEPEAAAEKTAERREERKKSPPHSTDDEHRTTVAAKTAKKTAEKTDIEASLSPSSKDESPKRALKSSQGNHQSSSRAQPSRPAQRSQPTHSVQSSTRTSSAATTASCSFGLRPHTAAGSRGRMNSAASAPAGNGRRPTSIRHVPSYGSLPPRRQPPLFPTPATSRKVSEEELDHIVGRVTKPTVSSRGGVDLRDKDWTYTRPAPRKVSENQLDDIVHRVTRPTVASRAGVDLQDKDFTYIQTPLLKTLPHIPGLDRRYLGLHHVPPQQLDDIVFRLTRMTSAYTAKFAPNRNVYVDMEPGAHMVQRRNTQFV